MQAIKHATKFFVVDLVGGVVYFLPWWYGRGRHAIELELFKQISSFSRTLHLKRLGKFLFTPMWGLTDWQSRVISIPIRIVHFLILLTIATVYSAILLAVLLVWLLFPVFVAYNILYQLGVVSFNIYSFL